MEPGWKSPSSEICRSIADLSSTNGGSGSGMGPPSLKVTYTLRNREQKKQNSRFITSMSHTPEEVPKRACVVAGVHIQLVGEANLRASGFNQVQVSDTPIQLFNDVTEQDQLCAICMI